jgi:hypothetical protein
LRCKLKSLQPGARPLWAVRGKTMVGSAELEPATSCL